MLKGEKKKTYQRNYMRRRRAKLKLNSAFVRPKTLNPVRPIEHNLSYVDADGNVIYDGE
mgnify:CR=1 FL=1